MFKSVERTDLNQISLTGARAIMLIGLLIVQPRSIEEIRKIFLDINIIDQDASYDILRIDLNTVKAMGCKISRAKASNGYRYVLSKHPFALKIPSDEIKALKKVYDKAKDKVNLASLIAYDELFRKIASHIDDEITKEQLLGISALKYFDSSLIKELYADCKNQRTLKLLYQKPTSTRAYEKELIAQNLVFKNNKIYLHGYDLKKKDYVIFNSVGIKSIISRKFENNNIDTLSTKIKFFIRNIEKEELEDNENIIEYLENSYLVEGSYHNEFIATQRIMELGPKCIVKEPEDFKNKIICLLKEMSKIYENNK